jgi:hypothetical protein
MYNLSTLNTLFKQKDIVVRGKIMPKIKDLKKAIDNGNLDRVQQIVAQLDNSGIDINNIQEKTIIHYLLFAELNPDITRQILQIFLDLRDGQGRLVADLNKVHVNAGAPISLAIDRNYIHIVQQILDARNNDGSLACNILAAGGHGEFWSPLTRALFMGRLEITQFLVDARAANGLPIINHQGLLNALAGAHAKGATRTTDNVATDWLRNYLAEFTDVDQQQVEQLFVQPAPLMQPDDNEFFANRQILIVQKLQLVLRLV